jgi:hypothetical protein
MGTLTRGVLINDVSIILYYIWETIFQYSDDEKIKPQKLHCLQFKRRATIIRPTIPNDGAKNETNHYQ